MGKNLTIVVVVLVVLFVSYIMFSSKQNTPVPATPQVTASSSPAMMSEVVVNLAKENQSTESGTATLTEVNGKVKVTLKLTGAPAGVVQPAHIHVGACPSVGAVKYPLTSPVNGMSETVLDVTFAELKSQLPLGINVHKSGAEATVYVSCGDLKF